MTLAELEEAKKTLRKTLESQKSAISVSKEELAMFVDFQLRFLKWTPSLSDKQELVSPNTKTASGLSSTIKSYV